MKKILPAVLVLSFFAFVLHDSRASAQTYNYGSSDNSSNTTLTPNNTSNNTSSSNSSNMNSTDNSARTTLTPSNNTNSNTNVGIPSTGGNMSTDPGAATPGIPSTGASGYAPSLYLIALLAVATGVAGVSLMKRAS